MNEIKLKSESFAIKLKTFLNDYFGTFLWRNVHNVKKQSQLVAINRIIFCIKMMMANGEIVRPFNEVYDKINFNFVCQNDEYRKCIARSNYCIDFRTTTANTALTMLID